MRKTTTIVPIGNFTPTLSRRVRETALASAQRHDVIISMHSTERYSWSALFDLAESLRALTPYPIRLSRTRPRTRALLGELGIENGWFVDDATVTPQARIFIREDRVWRSDRLTPVRRPASIAAPPAAYDSCDEPENLPKINAS